MKKEDIIKKIKGAVREEIERIPAPKVIKSKKDIERNKRYNTKEIYKKFGSE